jgi:transposase
MFLDQQSGEITWRSLKSRRDELAPFLKSLPGPTLVFVEACRAWEWVSDLCEELEIDLQLVDPAKMPEIAKSAKKTDRHDVEAMVDRMVLKGELPRSYRATRSERELRGLTRRLSALRKEVRNLLYRIHAVIDSHGMPAHKAFFIKTAWREKMRDRLSVDAWLVLESLLSQYDHVCSWKEKIEVRIKELMKVRDDSRRLQAIPGIGPVIAATILAESAGIERFTSARKYAAYTGLVPRVRASGGKVSIGHITRSGPSDLRWALGQAAMTGTRAKQTTAIKRTWRRKKKKGKHGKLALCAAAHKLARVVYVLLTRNEAFQAKPGRKKVA